MTTTFCVGTICYRTYEFKFVASLAKLLHARPEVQFIGCQNAGVEVGRSYLATQFLSMTNDDALLFVDADMRFEPDDAIRVVNQAIETGGLVGGVYAGRSARRPYPTGLPDRQPIRFFDISAPELASVEYVSGGFTAIPRLVLKTLAQGMEKVDGYYPFFHTFDRDGNHYSEDVAFCTRVADAGFPIMANTWIRLGHIGQYEYELGDMLRNQPHNGAMTVTKEGATYRAAPAHGFT